MSYRNYYETSTYGRNRDIGRNASTSTERPTTVTAKYTTTPSYKTSNIPVINDRSAREETPISAIANRYAGYSKTSAEKPNPKYEKKDYSKLAVPTVNTNRSRDVSPTSTASKYNLSRTSRHSSPDRRPIKSFKDKSHDGPLERDKDIPNKTDKTTNYSCLSNYKLYPRTSTYTRPTPRAEIKPETSVNRYAIGNRLSTSSYLRSPTPVKRPSLSPVNIIDVNKTENLKTTITNVIAEEDLKKQTVTDDCAINGGELSVGPNEDTETVTVVTRHTSPTPPGSSTYVRMRRADMAKTIEKIISRPKKKSNMVDKEIQSDRLDDPTRSSRFGSTSRTSMTNWTYYSPNINSYTGYAGRYSTQYSNLRENNTNSYDRSSRSRSKEPVESKVLKSQIEQEKDNDVQNTNETSEFEKQAHENKNEESSEIIINVNLTLKQTQSSSVGSTSDLTSPEVTRTNTHQLPPQPPKSESINKIKKTKVRKSSTDSSSDSSSKKVVKKRTKSASSTDSEQSTEKHKKSKEGKATSKGLNKSVSSSNLQKGPLKLKYSKCRENNSPESSITLSTQSSVSEDESISKSNVKEILKNSKCDISSLPIDQMTKHALQNKTEGTEDAKSFLIRALAPVTNLFKIRHQETSDCGRTENSETDCKDSLNIKNENSKLKNNTNNIIASNEDNLVKLKGIRKLESGDRSWWLESESENKKNNMDKEHNQDSYTENNNNIKRTFKPSCFPDDEKPWWLDSCANIPEGIERLSPPRKSSSDSDKSEKFSHFKIRQTDSSERKDWRLSNTDQVNTGNKPEVINGFKLSKSGSDQKACPIRRIRHIESGERPWWLSSEKNIPEGIEKLPTPPPQEESDSSDSDEVQVYIPLSQMPPFPLHIPDDEPLGTRRSPEGLETPTENEDYRIGRSSSPYENNRIFRRGFSNIPYQKAAEKYISRYTDIDDILGTSSQIYSPFMDSILARRTGQIPFDDDECQEIDPTQVRIHDSTAQMPIIKKLRCRSEIIDCRDEDQLDDATLQVFKDGDYGPYLDLDSTLGEQDEELEGLQDSRKNSLVLRTQLSVRVHAINEKLLHSQGRELRITLFSLKQLLQSDKDLVHEFVANKGLDSLMHVANMEDHNYLDYILRALGQILLYVDGMHGVMNHMRCIQWLYSLLSSKLRHIVKTALKLLLVFVEYTENNCLLLIEAIVSIDTSNSRKPWYNIMKILQDFDASDTELLIYVTTLINRCLNNIPDSDLYYDQVDCLQDQGIDDIIHLYMSKQGTDLDLLRQLQIFEAVLLFEDGDTTGAALKKLDESVITLLRQRSLNLSTTTRRKSKKQEKREKGTLEINVITSTPKRSQSRLPMLVTKDNKELSSALKRRRARSTRQAYQVIDDQQFFNSRNSTEYSYNDSDKSNYNFSTISNLSSSYTANSFSSSKYSNGTISENSNSVNEDEDCNRKSLPSLLANGNQRFTAGLKQRIQNGTLGHSVNNTDSLVVIRQKLDVNPETNDDRKILLNREHSIKDLAQRLTSSISPTTDEKPIRVSDMAGIVSKAKEELAKSKSKEIIKSPAIEKSTKVHEIKVSENDLHWEELKKGCMNREFHICDLDFSDLRHDSDDEMENQQFQRVCASNGPPPPPPNMLSHMNLPPPPPINFPTVPSGPTETDSANSTLKKNKKTVKLFWKEIQEAPVADPVKTKLGGSIWDDLPEIVLDTNMLEHLFESRSNDLIIKKLMEPKRNLILDAKRSNAINIAMKKLPTPQTIKAAIMKMDATIIGREGIEKLLTMLPTQEEKIKIQEAQFANPDLPLGSAEQFLLTLASINELPSRLKLWVFRLDFDNLEKEIAEPLMDLLQGIDLLKKNKTFKVILGTLRSVGSFLNGTKVKGFRLEYLSKVMEVKDTVHKHPLLYHICEMIIEKFPDTTDFFSEVGPVIRASKVDFEVLSSNLVKLEADCKASWDHLKRVAKHESSQIFKTKISEFITDAAERIILLSLIKKRVMRRYTKFVLYVGMASDDILRSKPSELLKVISEFALEYRTTRERVLQQLEKRANHRERNKTRGKMIIDMGNYSGKSGDACADTALKELLRADGPKRQLRRNVHPVLNGDAAADEEIIKSLVRCPASKRRPLNRDRRQNRIIDKSSLKQAIDGHQSWPS